MSGILQGQYLVAVFHHDEPCTFRWRSTNITFGNKKKIVYCPPVLNSLDGDTTYVYTCVPPGISVYRLVMYAYNINVPVYIKDNEIGTNQIIVKKI